jgi:UDP-N-acetylglucosamine--N-acetylmuramyl-(pentapeptide) pyrophosphoryl-undecaprenol N-acetylglucosamine transferase
MRPVLYYVHHHGLGHWRRALAVTAELARPVIFASTAPPPQPLPAGASYLPLPADAPARGAGPVVDANGRLHWAPTGHAGLLRRHQLLLAEAARRHVGLGVVDVSMEVAVLLRTSGIPVVAVRLPGGRTDPAHELGFALAEEVVMPVPPVWGLHTGLARTRAVGLVGASSPARPRVPVTPGRPRILVVVGAGGSALDAAACARIADELPGYEVRVAGLAAPPVEGGTGAATFLGRLPDPRAELAAAAVVIGNAGLGTVSDILTARRPFVALPGERPFGEQAATGRALARSGQAVVLTGLPAPGGWSEAVRAAVALGPGDQVVDGAPRFARVIERQARRLERIAGIPHQVREVVGQ